ncbi:MAG: hypothetical protein AB7K68_04485 [Bacteriovoracia bacterium]
MKYRLCAVCLLFLSSCGNPMGQKPKVDSNFQPGIPFVPATPVVDVPASAPVALGGDTGMKITPGSMRASGYDLGTKAAVTNNDVLARGTNISARLSLNKRKVR